MLSEWDVEAAAEMYEGGATLADVGERFGVSGSTVSRRLAGAGVQTRERGGGRKYDYPLTCENVHCDVVIEKGDYVARGRCARCASYFYENGRERNPAELGRLPSLTDADKAQMVREYKAGATLQEMADSRPGVGDARIKQALEEAGVALRPPGGKRVLSNAMVKKARYLHREKGVQVSAIARALGVGYQILWQAVDGQTWRDAGGPLPPADDGTKCAHCGVLSKDVVCRFCRAEGITAGRCVECDRVGTMNGAGPLLCYDHRRLRMVAMCEGGDAMER